jgi:hypothetical protein
LLICSCNQDLGVPADHPLKHERQQGQAEHRRPSPRSEKVMCTTRGDGQAGRAKRTREVAWPGSWVCSWVLAKWEGLRPFTFYQWRGQVWACSRGIRGILSS